MATEAEIKVKLNRASHLIDSGNKLEAKKLVDEVLQDFPQDAEAWFIASLATDTLDQKLSALELALQLNPQHSKAKEYMLHLKREIPTDVSQNHNSQDVGEVIGNVIGEVAKLIGGWLKLTFTNEQYSVSTKHSLHQQGENPKSMKFQGRGKIVTETIELKQGVYKIKYKMPTDNNVNVLIVNIYTGKKYHFVFEKGAGERTYHLEQEARYVFEIDDYGKNYSWYFEFELLT